MKTWVCALVLAVLSGVCHCQCNNGVLLKDKFPRAQKTFPDIRAVTAGQFQMAVEFTSVNEKRTDYFVEYYDGDQKRGRIDVLDGGKTTKYFYYVDSLEAFEVSESEMNCFERNETNIPPFMKYGMREWYYIDGGEKIHGPSAMFRNAYEDRNKPKKMKYMGVSQGYVRGIAAEYWRRCIGKNLTADYYFSVGYREGVYGVEDLTSIPLKIDVYGVDVDNRDISKELYPQVYHIMSYTPFLEDPYYTFELPVGMGCGRKPNEDDFEIPDFDGQNLYAGAEAIYTDYDEGGNSYSSVFFYALDVDASYSSYYYTPWTKVDGKLMAGDPIHVVYDTKNKYVYNTTFGDGKCDVGGVNRYIPNYSLPGGNNGFISLTDSSMFYPNNEFYYLGEGIDRGYKVDIYERSFATGYPLGDRVVKNSIVTHYYLKSSEIKEGPRAVKNALSRIRMSFNGTDEDGRKMNAILNFNFFVFSTGIPDKSMIFSISQCARDEDDVMFIRVGFNAEEEQFELIEENIPSAVENARTFFREITDIPPARLPQVMVDFTDMLYVTFFVLERPPFELDFDPPNWNTTISGAAESKGITFLNDCANLCLENDLDCWGFAHCGATCYIGAGDRTESKLETNYGCVFYNRTNFNVVPRLRVIKRNLQRAVERGEPTMSVAKKDGGVVDFKPNFIGDAVFGESQEIFDLMEMETNTRLRVVKVGHKLKTDSGENIAKQFGSLTYGECQRFCLDFRACETVSYCLSSGECVLSLTHAEDIGATMFTPDSFCNVLSRKYDDKFTRSPGIVLSQNALKTVDASNEEECAKACVKETSFECLSFDSCQTSDNKGGCRLHAVHILDVKDNEAAVKKEIVCGHYSRKYTYDFKRESKKKTVGEVIALSTGLTTEECARECIEYSLGKCQGFDACQGRDRSTSCVILTQNPSNMSTVFSAECSHYVRFVPPEGLEPLQKSVSKSVAGGVGFLLFVIGVVLGGLIVFGVAYFRVNRSR